MSIVDEAVQDGVGVGGVPNDLMPGRQGELGGDDRRPSAVSLLENFEQIVTGAGVEGLEAEVVENEQIGAAEGLDEARMAAVASGERLRIAGRKAAPNAPPIAVLPNGARRSTRRAFAPISLECGQPGCGLYEECSGVKRSR